ncbi:NADH:flavin oxidoreductase/NADH oxidase [Coprinellus micaceus]|uniref:NADH:flavin oxidoreductase/NADH oxidase n=1 Tax=Coprinellus micaceus TaxID=71717 RepID=A0A4Y7T8F1_COPMI|nr:NADH:flavin oxidoreductase/NADH oxidase [Coprinellus micaceus]
MAESDKEVETMLYLKRQPDFDVGGAKAQWILFTPIQVGRMGLKHRIVHAPLTRLKATRTGHVPVVELQKKYYSQRTGVPGTLLISPATFVGPEAGGYAYVEGIWSEEQIESWKQITTVVHARGSYIYCQIWALGRAAQPAVLTEEGNYPYTAPSPVPLPHRRGAFPPPRTMTLEEIDRYVELFAKAAGNAMQAGFDGVEVHCASGYLIDQFLQDITNKRVDDYGGSVENRSRFGLRVVHAVVREVGADRVGIRLSPWSRYNSMMMDDPIPQFTHFVSELATSHPDLAYLHVLEPLSETPPNPENPTFGESNDFLRKIWAPRPFISCGEHTRDRALSVSQEKGGLIAFGRPFISNPDLPFRLRHNIPLATADGRTFYIPSDHPETEKGYIDYPPSEEFTQQSSQAMAKL